jgi:hypothetical protein
MTATIRLSIELANEQAVPRPEEVIEIRVAATDQMLGLDLDDEWRDGVAGTGSPRDGASAGSP